ncbi:MAG: RNA polymerase sigma factor [Phaeodactylibacter sp.]|uniref:RNA polymerase sigma factor n=1 Tax=Phaeodactylibacter sp. TaxID=1940289 RepID=UPI0032F0928C
MLIASKICEELTDQEVVARALQEVDYFSCLYQRYEPSLRRYVQHMTGAGPTGAEDILQDAFIKIWRNLRAYNPKMKLSSWMYRIVHNEAISALRKQNAFGKNKTVDWADAEPMLLRTLLSEVEAADEDRISTQQLRQWVQELPLKYREIVLLRYFEELDYEAISDVLQIPEGTVATRLNRARKALEKAAKP